MSNMRSEQIVAVVEVVRPSIISDYQYKQTILATGVNILHASGKDAQQSIFHFHFHIFPRFENDGLDAWPKLNHIQEDKQTILQKLLGN